MPDYDSLSYRNELRVSIDTSGPLKNIEVDRIIARIRTELYLIQSHNKRNEYILSKTIDDLKKAIKITELKNNDFLDIKELYESPIFEKKTEAKLKNHLCGLIILYRYNIDNSHKGNSLQKLCSNLSDEIVDIIKLDNSKFSSETIFKSYKTVRKLLNERIKLL